MKACSLFASLILFLVVQPAVASTVVRVPADQPTIQAGINVVSNGDTVLVSPGTYTENINFNGKAITVKSSNGAKVTIIDGGNVAPVVTFSTGETRSSTLSGFTVQNGTSTFTSGYEGGGIVISSASPTIKSNIVQNNTACSAGGGIALGFSSPLIQGNIVRNNSQSGCTGGVGGGGISVRGASSAQIIGNTIENNTWSSASGGGISLFGAGSPLIENNVIIGNSSSQGGGISMVNEADEVIVQNLIAKNSSPDGAEIYSSVPQSTTGFRLVNNTILSNGASDAAVVADGFNANAQIINNLIIAPAGESALLCNPIYKDGPPIVQFNDAFTPQGNSYDGMCSGFSGTNGNISADPKFVNTKANNYRVLGGSPVIDVGDNSAPDLPSTDIVGDPRIINGNDGPTAIIDMGAYEFVPVSLTPKSLYFGTQAVGSTTTKTVTLTNAQDRSLSISSKTVPTGYKVSGCGSSVAAFSSCSLTVTFHPLTTGVYKGKLTVKDNAGNSPQTVSLSGNAQ
jgi:parallel beta-helix repeat protein